jgi:hypothetical protein
MFNTTTRIYITSYYNTLTKGSAGRWEEADGIGSVAKAEKWPTCSANGS